MLGSFRGSLLKDGNKWLRPLRFALPLRSLPHVWLLRPSSHSLVIRHRCLFRPVLRNEQEFENDGISCVINFHSSGIMFLEPPTGQTPTGTPSTTQTLNLLRPPSCSSPSKTTPRPTTIRCWCVCSRTTTYSPSTRGSYYGRV